MTVHNLRSVWACLLTGMMATVPAFAADAVTEAKARLLDNVKYLSSDDLEGRGVGTEGLNHAAEFVRQQFAAAGLDITRVDGGAFQKFDIVSGAKIVGTPMVEFLGPENKTIALAADKDFQPCSFAGSGQFDAEVVFCGYGIEAKDLDYNDFADIDVTGKVVILMRRNPGQGQADGKFSAKGPHGISRHAELRTKLSQAVQHGAAAVLFVNDPYAVKKKAEDRQAGIAKSQAEVAELADALLSTDKSAADKVDEATKKLADAVAKWKSLKAKTTEAAGDDELMAFGYAGHGEGKAGPPAFHITQAQADALLKPALGKTLAELEAAIDADGKPHSAVLPGWKVRGGSTVERIHTDVSNVIGVLEGTGPLADETIVIGAHYDHVGRGGPNSLSPGSTDVHNGADDNASGTVALIELARRLAARPEKLSRRLVFMAFTGEELGLLGSARYVKEPVFPLEKTIAMFNMDMVGRLKDDKLIVYGTGT
ncbi:MAG TPA: M28 family peptidase, partial [Planctomycetaceae bacterium]|nr:M28 family peptidase [Planctomycetaceae bacterium]